MRRAPDLGALRAFARATWLLWLLLPGALLPFASGQGEPRPWPAPLARPLAGEPSWSHAEGRERLLSALVTLFERNYWNADHRDWSAWGAAHRDAVVGAASRGELDAALTRMVRELADDHSAWVGLPRGQPPAPGGGAPSAPRLGVQFAHVRGRGLVVERVYPTTPAAAADLRRADVVTGVEGVDLRDLGSLFEANAVVAEALLRGPTRLRVLRGRTALELEVVGAEFAFADVANLPYAVMLDATVGYLHVPTFNDAGVGAAMHQALAELNAAGARSLVLDLRGNLGGRLVEAGLLMGAFVEGSWARATARGGVAWVAEVARERDPAAAWRGVARLVALDGGVLAEARMADPVGFVGPIVVVVGSETASAAEAVAAALVDLGRARVVGESTAGNVEAVQAFELPDGSRALVAIALLEGVGGASFVEGVRVDVVARASVIDLAQGFDAPVAEARRLLGGLPFTPGRLF